MKVRYQCVDCKAIKQRDPNKNDGYCNDCDGLLKRIPGKLELKHDRLARIQLDKFEREAKRAISNKNRNEIPPLRAKYYPYHFGRRTFGADY